MCGIAGFIGFQTAHPCDSINALTRMGSAISHRGPNDSGTWIDVASSVGLVHRRLSIIDLSPAGHQPMTSPSGRYVMVFNGEIYNHVGLRVESEKLAFNAPCSLSPTKIQSSISWRGHSDTETLLACFDAWGIERTLKLCVGMFAFAVWDNHLRELVLGRDRIGEKPLYYGFQDGVFLFASELKALKAHPAFHAELDQNAIAQYMRYNYVPSPLSIYKDILSYHRRQFCVFHHL